MKFVACDEKETNYVIKSYKSTKLLTIIEEFIESDLECAKITEHTYVTPSSCAWALNEAIKRYHKTSIKAITRKGEVYLIKLLQ